MNGDKLLTVDEVAEKLRCSPRTIMRLRRHPLRKLPGFKIAHRLLFDPADIERWLERFKRAS